MSSAIARRERVRQAAFDLGFARVGFAAADQPLNHADFFERWLDAGHAATMDYLERARSQRHVPAALLPGARTAIVTLTAYGRDADPPPPAAHGRVARYARGVDYHAHLHSRLQALAERLPEAVSPGSEAQMGASTTNEHSPIDCRSCVDTLPLLERELAMAAGLGFIGHNTMLITPGLGSYTLIGTLLTTLELPPDSAPRPRCGSCRACLDACPTGALIDLRLLDARRCLSYLTIEDRREDPGPDVADQLTRGGGWIFGCDACQEVCPYNVPTANMARQAPDPELAPANAQATLPLRMLRDLRASDYRRLVRRRAFARVARRLWQRRATLLLEAQEAPRVVDEDPLDQTPR